MKDFKNMRDTFWAHTSRCPMHQILFYRFLPKEAGSFGNNIEKKPKQLHPKLKKYGYFIFKNIKFSNCNPVQVVAFQQNYFNFVEE